MHLTERSPKATVEPLNGRCARHPFDQAADVCAQCGLAFCPSCMVYARGPRQPGLCIPCALVVAGLRKGNLPAPLSRKAFKQRREELANAIASAPPLPDRWDVEPTTPQHWVEAEAAARGSAPAMPDREINWVV